MSARRFNPSAYFDNQLSKFINTNGFLARDEKGKSTPIQPFLLQTPDRILNFEYI